MYVYYKQYMCTFINVFLIGPWNEWRISRSPKACAWQFQSPDALYIQKGLGSLSICTYSCFGETLCLLRLVFCTSV